MQSRCLTLPKRMPMHIVQRIQSAFKRRSKRLAKKTPPNVAKTPCASNIAALVERHPWVGLTKFENKWQLKQEAVRRGLGLT